MANTLPCPNPVCTHQFSQAELHAAAQLACPKCGFRMQGKGTASAKPAAPAGSKPAVSKPASAAPKPKPAATPPMATPIATKGAAANPPLAAPVQASPVAVAEAVPANSAPPPSEESIPEGTFFNPGAGPIGPLVHSGSAKRRTNWTKIAIAFFAVGFAICLVVIGIALIVIYVAPGALGGRGLAEGDTFTGILRNQKGESEKVYKLVLSRADWTPDIDIRNRFEAHTAFKHNEEVCWFALAVKDFGMQRPRDSDLLRMAVSRLEGYFGDALELGAKADAGKFAEQASLRLQFRGVTKSTQWDGECHVFFKNGVAYWMFIASNDKAVAERFAEELSTSHVRVESARYGWREQPAPTETFASSSGKFEFTVVKGAWERTPDEKYELVLGGTYQEKKDNSKNAIVWIYTLEKQADLAAAVKVVQSDWGDKLKEQINANAKLLHAPEVTPGQPELGELNNVGNRRGRIVDLKMQLADEAKPRRYYLMAVVNDPDICYAILGECAWESRAIWRQEFVEMFKSFRVK